ncbi:hypothetical protein TREMEDRAFT_57719, partial [Tremella mesenterica DSM 1558]
MSSLTTQTVTTKVSGSNESHGLDTGNSTIIPTSHGKGVRADKEFSASVNHHDVSQPMFDNRHTHDDRFVPTSPPGENNRIPFGHGIEYSFAAIQTTGGKTSSSFRPRNKSTKRSVTFQPTTVTIHQPLPTTNTKQAPLLVNLHKDNVTVESADDEKLEEEEDDITHPEWKTVMLKAHDLPSYTRHSAIEHVTQLLRHGPPLHFIDRDGKTQIV